MLAGTLDWAPLRESGNDGPGMRPASAPNPKGIQVKGSKCIRALCMSIIPTLGYLDPHGKNPKEKEP